jgi:signal peptidase II
MLALKKNSFILIFIQDFMKDVRLNFKQNKKIIFCNLIVLIFCIILDQISKQFMLSFLISKPFNSYPILPFFNFTLALNTGVSFSLFAGMENGKIILSVIAILISIFLTYLFLKEKNKLFSLAYSLIISGAIGNTIDRVMYGGVIDFLDFYIKNWHYPIFNLADCFIFIGAVIFIFGDLFKKKYEA